MQPTRIPWIRTIAYGLVAEILVGVLFGLTTQLLGTASGQYSTMPFSFLVICAFAFIAARRSSRPLLQGFLVGVAAFSVYYAILLVGTAAMWIAGVSPDDVTVGPPPPALIYPIAHALKLLGGLAGGYLAGHRSRATVQP